MNKKTVAITGAAGRIGKVIVPMLRKHFDLLLIDKIKIKSDHDKVFTGDIRNRKFLETALNDADAIIHLAAIPDDDDFYTKLMPMNIEATYTVFDMAHTCGINKIIFASTCQTVFGYSNAVHVTTAMPIKPYNVYACTKMFGEALAKYYSDKYAMSIICFRIGWFQDYDSELLTDTEIRKEWCSPKDLKQLFVKSIESNLKFGVFFAISDNKDKHWDIEDVKSALKYEPEDKG